jgi:hypothetical protein
MGILMAFAVGYFVGARAGNDRLDEVIASLKAVRESEEFHALLDSLRTHSAHMLQELSTYLSAAERGVPLPIDDLVARVRGLIGREDFTSGAS